MWKPAGSLIFARLRLSASALAPPCGTIGMLGAAPVVLNWPSLSRLSGAFCAKVAVVASSVAVTVASRRMRIALPPIVLDLCLPVRISLPHRAELATAARSSTGVMNGRADRRQNLGAAFHPEKYVRDELARDGSSSISS